MIEASQAHAAAMAAVHEAAFGAAAWDAAAFATLLGQPGVFGLIDPRGGCVLVRVAADEAEILTIGVAEKRLGIGRDLMQAALARAAGKAMFLEVAAGNVAARGLYEGLGFIEVGVRRRYYPDGDDALVLRLGLMMGGAALTHPTGAVA